MAVVIMSREMSAKPITASTAAAASTLGTKPSRANRGERSSTRNMAKVASST